MTFARPFLAEAEDGPVDRRVIRVDFPPVKAGIAAALRRAFEAPRQAEDCDGHFNALLSRLH